VLQSTKFELVINSRTGMRSPYALHRLATRCGGSRLPAFPHMSNIEAALLLPQFNRMRDKLARRHALAERYDRAFANIDGIEVPSSRSNSVHARHVYTIWCHACARDHLLAHLHTERIGAVVNYRPIHLMSYFASATATALAISRFPNRSGIQRYRCRSIRICRSTMSTW
jgi:hypothetical protein